MNAVNYIQTAKIAQTKLLRVLKNPQKLETSLNNGSFEMLCQNVADKFTDKPTIMDNPKAHTTRVLDAIFTYSKAEILRTLGKDDRMASEVNVLANRLKQKGTFVKKFRDAYDNSNRIIANTSEQPMGGSLESGLFIRTGLNANINAAFNSCDRMPKFEVVDNMVEIAKEGLSNLKPQNEEKLIGLAERFFHLSKNPIKSGDEAIELPTPVLRQIRKLQVHSHHMPDKEVVESSKNLVDTFTQEVIAKPAQKNKLSRFISDSETIQSAKRALSKSKLLKELKTRAHKMGAPEVLGTATEISEKEKNKKSLLARLKDNLLNMVF